MYDYTLKAELDTIEKQGKGLKAYTISARYNTGQSSAWVDCFNVLSYSIIRNYATDFGDMRYITVQIPLGDYTFDIVPNRDTLRVQVTSKHTELTGSSGKPVRKVSEYVAICQNTDNQNIENPKMNEYHRALLNQRGFANVEFQLFDDATYNVRMVTVGGVYRDVSPVDVLLFTLGKTTELEGPNHRKLVNGVEILPGYNTTKRRQIPVPHGTRLVDLPHFLQNKDGGVYSGDISCYLQDNFWYVFPPYNTKIFTQYRDTVTILLVPAEYTRSEKTYRVSGDNLVLRNTGKINVVDNTLSDKLNNNNGKMFVNADQMLDKNQTLKNNKVTLSRAKTMTEFKSGDLGTVSNNVQFAEERVTSNPFKHYSELARNNCRYIDIEWAMGDIDLIRPCPIQVKMVENGRIKTYNGTIASVSSVFTPIEEGTVKQTYYNTLRLGLLVER